MHRIDMLSRCFSFTVVLSFSSANERETFDTTADLSVSKYPFKILCNLNASIVVIYTAETAELLLVIHFLDLRDMSGSGFCLRTSFPLLAKGLLCHWILIIKWVAVTFVCIK